MKLRIILFWISILMSSAVQAAAQEVTIPDPVLNSSIRLALARPQGALTPEDLLRLSDLRVSGPVLSLEGLGAAHNLTSLGLSGTPLKRVELPSGLTNLIHLFLGENQLTNFTLPDDLTRLRTLDVRQNELSVPDLQSLGAAHNLTSLDLSGNQLKTVELPSGLTNLSQLSLRGNQLTNLTLPDDLTRLGFLDVSLNRLADLRFPANLPPLWHLDLSDNALTDVSVVSRLSRLEFLDLTRNRITELSFLSNLTLLEALYLGGNQVIHASLPASLTQLGALNLSNNQLTDISLPASLLNLRGIDLSSNRLTEVSLVDWPVTLQPLDTLNLSHNQLTNVKLPARLIYSAITVDLSDNPLDRVFVFEDRNPGEMLLTFVSEAQNWFDKQTFASKASPIVIYRSGPSDPGPTINVTVRLDSAGFDRQRINAVEIKVTGPLGVYSVATSTDLRIWTELGNVSNWLGTILFTDVRPLGSPQRYYRIRPVF
jgi:Leucine-rich repeat (LRR) protein